MSYLIAHPTLYKVAEVLYWTVIIALMLFMLWRSGKSEAATKFKLGQADARKFVDTGVTTAEIEGFLRVQRDGGRYGPYEAGMNSVLKGTAK
jgi:hypothetical protein